MTSVLFVVTIPTEAAEARLKTKYFRKHLEMHGSESEDRPFSSLPTVPTIVTPLTGQRTDRSTKCPMPLSRSASALQSPNTSLTSNMEQSTSFKSLEDTTSIDVEKGMPARQGDKLEVEGMESAALFRKSWEGLRDIITSAKRKPESQKKKEPNENDLCLPPESSMEKVLAEILKKYHVPNQVWTKDTAGATHQVVFSMEYNQTCENIIYKFHEWGIGEREGSTLSVINCIATKATTEAAEDNEYQAQEMNAQKRGIWDRFMNSVRSRQNVAQVVRDVRQDAAINFDFLILLIAAAILAAFGLMENSTIFLSSSMLISPLMGPIIAGIFGTVIKDAKLGWMGLKNELFGVFLATLVGFIFGMIVCSIDVHYSKSGALSTEILSRCEMHSVIVGICTAIPSGAAAAIGILGGNIGSLVGVAISASLLPPAVNSGLLWALAFAYKCFGLNPARLDNVGKPNRYSNDQTTELAIMGSISMCLTITNVICIYLMGVLVLKVKEIAPVLTNSNSKFWKNDIQMARNLNKAGFNTETAIIDEFTSLPQEDQQALSLQYDFFRQLHIDHDNYQHTWSPVSNRHAFDALQETQREPYITVHGLERCHLQRPTYKDQSSRGNYRDHILEITRRNTVPSRPRLPFGQSVFAGRANVISILDPMPTPTTPECVDVVRGRKFIVTPADDPLATPPTDLSEVDV